MRITVKTLDSRDHNFDVDSNITIKDFKEIISPTINIPADRITLLFKGRALVDSHSLTTVGLEDSTVHAVERIHMHRPTTTIPTEAEQNNSTPTNLQSSVPRGQNQTNEFVNTVNRVMHAIQTSLYNRGHMPDSISERIDIARQFIEHTGYIYNELQSMENIQNFSQMQIDSQESQPRDPGILNLARAADQLSTALEQLVSVLRVYGRFLRVAARDDSSGLSMLPDYAQLADRTDNMLHSVSHATHLLSDITLSHTNETNQENSRFKLSLPRANQTPLANERTQGDATSDEITTNRSSVPTTNSATLNAENPQGNTNQDALGYLLTVQLTAQMNDSNHRNLSGVASNSQPFPTATASSTTNTPRPILATAGGSNSARNSIDITLNARQVNSFSDMPFLPPLSYQTLSSFSLSNPSTRPNEIPPPRQQSIPPRDPFWLCQSHLVGSYTPQFNMADIQPDGPYISFINRIPAQRNRSSRGTQTTEPTRNQSSAVPRATLRPTTSQTTSSWTELFNEEEQAIILEDERRQKSIKPNAYSNAYLAGSPNYAELLKTQQEAQQFLETRLSDSFTEFASQHGVSSTVGLSEIIEGNPHLEEEFESLIESKLSEKINDYENFDEKKYKNCAKKRRNN